MWLGMDSILGAGRHKSSVMCAVKWCGHGCMALSSAVSSLLFTYFHAIFCLYSCNVYRPHWSIWASVLLHVVPTCRENIVPKVSAPESLQFTWFIWQRSLLPATHSWNVYVSSSLLASTSFVELFELWKQILSFTNGFPVVFLTCFSLTISLCKRVWGIPTGKSFWTC